jgi:tRNA A-37 threonylcarbamoyl transferase component Bud32
MRFVFSPAAGAATDLLTLPWEVPLAEWSDDRVVEIPQRGRTRHVVRFVTAADQVFAVKELPEDAARQEYRVLRRLHELHIPAVEVVGVVVDRPDGQEALLVTRFLDASSSFLALFANPRGAHLTSRVMDAQVELLVRLHLAGVVWGDCSLSNTLFRFDAGTLAAYLVDAETGELHERLSQRQRDHDLDVAYGRVVSELVDLRSRHSLAEDVDPALAAADLVARYEQLWATLTSEEVVPREEQRFHIAERIRRLQDLGFEVGELEVIDVPGGGSRLRLTTRVAEPGHHRRLLFARTGLDVGENQARRLLADIAGHRAWLERVEGRRVPEAVAAVRWLAEVYEPTIADVPADLRRRLGTAEIYHEVLEHRWFLSERTGRDVGMAAAVRDYVARVLPGVPDDLVTPAPGPLQPGSAAAVPLGAQPRSSAPSAAPS